MNAAAHPQSSVGKEVSLTNLKGYCERHFARHGATLVCVLQTTDPRRCGLCLAHICIALLRVLKRMQKEQYIARSGWMFSPPASTIERSGVYSRKVVDRRPLDRRSLYHALRRFISYVFMALNRSCKTH